MEECAVRQRGRVVGLDGGEIDLIYGLVTREIRMEGMTLENYGICIHADTGERIESSTVWDISPDLKTVEELLALLYRMEVTPVTLQDIVCDYIEK